MSTDDRKVSFEEKLAALRAEYAERLNGVIDEIADHWAILSTMEMADDAYRQQADTFVFAVHSLAGSAGTYGFTRVSEICREIENNHRTVSGPDQLATIKDAQDALVKQLLDERT